MEWLSIPLILLAISTWLNGWPSFITHNHYYNECNDEKNDEK
jgi:hypothetical protein